MIGKLGTVCMTGTFNKEKQSFAAYPETRMGTVTRKSMLQLCNIDDPDLLTQEIVIKNIDKLRDKLFPKVKQNLTALYNQLLFVSRIPSECHMLRVSSDLLPLFDHPVLSSIYFYDDKMTGFIDIMLDKCKTVVDKFNITVTTHPDQYVLINSVSESVRQQSFRSLNYHRYFMERLTTADKSCINIHLEGNLDHLPEFDKGCYLHLIPWLSFENSDKNGKIFTGNTENTLAICEKYNIKMLYDCHHQLVSSNNYLDFDSETFKRILKTWKGQEPIFHVSQSRETDSISRAHSEFIDDIKVIEQVKEMLNFGSVEVEAKAKTSAVLDLYSKIYM